MKTFIYLFILVIAFCSCNNKNSQDQKSEVNSTKEFKDSVSDNSDRKTEVKEQPKSSAIDAVNDTKLLKTDKTVHIAKPEKKNDTDIEIKIFKNTELSGYGYDIILNGHTYVHQPNIPAKPGNNGFESEVLARKVAQLVSDKIRNNIMPPTVEVKELDSLGVR